MADAKAPSSRPSAGKRPGGMHPLFLGIVIGLLLGVFLALGIAIWLNRSASPFVDREKPAQPLPPIKSAEPRGESKTPPAAPNAAGSGNEKPRFEFYQILPGEKDAARRPAVAQPTPSPAPPAASKPAEPPKPPPEPVKPTAKTGESLFLQAGAFQNESDAENLKAKIAFAGFEAHIAKVNAADKGTLFRVRLGPYKSQEEVNRIKTALSQNGIGTAVVRAE